MVCARSCVCLVLLQFLVVEKVRGQNSLSQEDRDVILTAHNMLRGGVNPPASNREAVVRSSIGCIRQKGWGGKEGDRIERGVMRRKEGKILSSPSFYISLERRGMQELGRWRGESKREIERRRSYREI